MATQVCVPYMACNSMPNMVDVVNMVDMPNMVDVAGDNVTIDDNVSVVDELPPSPSPSQSPSPSHQVERVYIKGAKNISSKQALLIIPITKYFSNEYNLKRLLSILSGDTIISLRLIDWFVTNYSKSNDVMFDKMRYEAIRNGKNPDEVVKCFENMVMVYSNYKGQLKECSKKQFDPFCRRARVRFYYDYNTGKYFLTTVGQLNFFKWAIENYIVDYIEEHFKAIEDDMNDKQSQNLLKKLQLQSCDIVDAVSSSASSSASSSPMSSNNNATVVAASIPIKITKKRGAPRKYPLAPEGATIEQVTTEQKTAELEEPAEVANASVVGLSELQAKQKIKKQALSGTKKKTKELIVPHIRTMSKHFISATVTFD